MWTYFKFVFTSKAKITFKFIFEVRAIVFNAILKQYFCYIVAQNVKK